MLNDYIDVSEAYKLENLTNSDKIGAENGCIYLLTKGYLNRTELTKQAVLMAVIPLLNPELY